MKLARSSFYYKPRAKSPDRMKVEADLRDRIETICLEFPRYGYRRVTYQLKHEGWQINHKKVLRLMRESDLLCWVRRKWVKTTDSRHRFPRYPNLIKGMVINRLNQAWVARHHINWDWHRLCLSGSDTGCILSAGDWVRCLRRTGHSADNGGVG